MNDQCLCKSTEVLIFPCSGGSNVGQIANEAAKDLTTLNKGKMYCLAGVNGGLKIPNNGGLKFPTLNMSFSIVMMEVLNVIDGGTIHDTTPEHQGIEHQRNKS